jgi:hypothetical protein
LERDENLAKCWLDPVRLHESGGFRDAESLCLRSIIAGGQHDRGHDKGNEAASPEVDHRRLLKDNTAKQP